LISISILDLEKQNIDRKNRKRKKTKQRK